MFCTMQSHVVLLATILCCLIQLNTSNGDNKSEWHVTHSTLPVYSKNGPPDGFSLNLTWQSGNDFKPKQVFLSLKKSAAVKQNLPIYTTDKNGKPVQKSLLVMKSSRFYQDTKSQASISLSSYREKSFTLKGSFLLDNEMYEVEPYHPNIHKRSTSAQEGDHIVKKREEKEHKHLTDYIVPKEGNHIERTLLKNISDPRNATTKTREHGHSKRQVTSSTTYTVEIYMVVDYYLYTRLLESMREIGYLEGIDSYIAFIMGHMINEVDVMYRSIEARSAFTWTIGAKLSKLHIASTGAQSTWTYPSPSGYLDTTTSLEAITSWMNSNSDTLPADVDHYTLVTGLDLKRGEYTGVSGYAYIGGACGTSQTSVVEFGSSTTIAHEIGHNLGAQHDGEGNSCSDGDQYILSSVVQQPDERTQWNTRQFSTCSITSFNTFFQTLDRENRNCLINTGTDNPDLSDVSQARVGQVLSVHEQCKLFYGESYYYSGNTEQYRDICQALWCTETGSVTYSKQGAMQYTSCGNRKWCIEGICVADEDAPEVDESCPIGDTPGIIFTSSDLRCTIVTSDDCNSQPHVAELCCQTCAQYSTPELGEDCPFGDKNRFTSIFKNVYLTCQTVTGVECGTQQAVKVSCCKTCPTMLTPWLGPNCKYGDKNKGCSAINAYQCEGNAALCCASCCKFNGPDFGYTCDPPITEISSRSITTPQMTLPSSSNSTTKTSQPSITTKRLGTPTTTLTTPSSNAAIQSTTRTPVVLATSTLDFVTDQEKEGFTTAHTLDECQDGDSTALPYAEPNITCASITSLHCAYDSDVAEVCCSTCLKFKKPWLGPYCLYGDKFLFCSSWHEEECLQDNNDSCCETCCPFNGSVGGTGSCYPPASTESTASVSAFRTTAPTTFKSFTARPMTNTSTETAEDRTVSIRSELVTTKPTTTEIMRNNCSDSAASCQNKTTSDCARDDAVSKVCCATCKKLSKPWLGPECLYGDKEATCSELTTEEECRNNRAQCCESCCKVNGPLDGYSCDEQNIISEIDEQIIEKIKESLSELNSTGSTHQSVNVILLPVLGLWFILSN